jgi:predicted Zn-dependent protease with MMP-like domain
MPARIVVYRRPVETRATDSRELAALVNDVVVEQAASLLGVDPRELDAGYDPDGD